MPRRDRGTAPTNRPMTPEEQEEHARWLASDAARVATGRRSRIAATATTSNNIQPTNENPSSQAIPIDEDPCGDPC